MYVSFLKYFAYVLNRWRQCNTYHWKTQVFKRFKTHILFWQLIQTFLLDWIRAQHLVITFMEPDCNIQFLKWDLLFLFFYWKTQIFKRFKNHILLRQLTQTFSFDWIRARHLVAKLMEPDRYIHFLKWDLPLFLFFV